jgi:hypothetical protein
MLFFISNFFVHRDKNFIATILVTIAPHVVYEFSSGVKHSVPDTIRNMYFKPIGHLLEKFSPISKPDPTDRVLTERAVALVRRAEIENPAYLGAQGVRGLLEWCARS